MTVLIVEDVMAMREVIRQVVEEAVGLLSHSPVRIDVAANLAEAKHSLGRHRPQLCLLDVTLGLESGLSLLPDLLAGGTEVWIAAASPWPAGQGFPAGVRGVWAKPDGGRGSRETLIQILSPHLRSLTPG